MRFTSDVAQALAALSLDSGLVETGVPTLDRLGTDHGLRAIEPLAPARPGPGPGQPEALLNIDEKKNEV